MPASEFGDGQLTLAAVDDDVEFDSYQYDPMDLPELDIDFTDLSGAQATEDQRETPDRSDDLEYLTPPFAEPCEITGNIVAELWVATDAEDTDFSVALIRVANDGQWIAFRGGVQRLRYAKDPRRDQPVPPNTVTKVSVDLWATSIEMQPGERLALVVSSWGWPGYGRNLNTLESVLTATEAKVATNRIYHTEQYPSALVLPVIPREGAGVVLQSAKE